MLVRLKQKISHSWYWYFKWIVEKYLKKSMTENVPNGKRYKIIIQEEG